MAQYIPAPQAPDDSGFEHSVKQALALSRRLYLVAEAEAEPQHSAPRADAADADAEAVAIALGLLSLAPSTAGGPR